jgi:vacuolar protein sorting-associated protein 26
MRVILNKISHDDTSWKGKGALCFFIEFKWIRYHLKDVIIGKIYFLMVRIKIKNMELEIRRRESTGSGPSTYVETETLSKFELMDGAPVRGT